jgi:hypothetical protein
MFHDFYYTQFTNLSNGQIESANFYMTWFDWHFKTGDSWHALYDYEHSYEHLFAPFAISPGVVLPIGEYRFDRWKINFMSAARRKLSGGFTYTFGDYWSGRANQINANVGIKLQPRFNFNLSTNQTWARLPQGNFTARIHTSTINYTTSPRLAFSNLLQYDNRSRNLGWQGRVRWTLRPGDDFYFILNQGWIQEPGEPVRFRPQDRKLSLKFQSSVRF